ncbi:MAG: ANTAR domain-containing protein [Prevotella sp.]|nr:ANTAR domain-containing protein [Prevotella sp.]
MRGDTVSASSTSADGKSVIIFSADSETAGNISLAASEFGFGQISVSDGNGGRDLLSREVRDVAFVNAPLENEFGLELAAFAAEIGCGVIIAAPAKLCGEMAKKIGGADIFILPKPMNKALLLQTFRYVTVVRDQKLGLREENLALENRLRDAKLIDRAKCVLVQYLRISEADAHRQIQKRAMDMRVPLAAIAKDILKTYEM